MSNLNEITLFTPKDGKGLLRSHKELSENPELNKMTQDDLYFAWLIGIQNSPIDHEKDPEWRRQSAAARVFKNKDKAKQDRYAKGDLPEDVQTAIKIFSRFVPEARVAASLMVEKIFNNLSKLVDVDVKSDFIYNDKDGNPQIDWTGRKQYVDTATTISKTLPDLIKQIEEGFGTPQEQKTDSGVKAIDIYHQTRKD